MTFAFLSYFKDFLFSQYFFSEYSVSKCFVFVFTFAVESGLHVHQASIKSHILSRMSFNFLSFYRDCMYAGSPPQPVCMQFWGPNTASGLLCKHYTN